MRHAKSDWQTGALTDFDRPLNKRGRRAASDMGEFLAGMDRPPDRIISSSALRARQTIERVFLQTRWRPDRLRFEPGLYLASLDQLLECCRAESDCDSLMLVGHNPGLEDLLEYLCDDPIERTKKGKLFTTANIAEIELSARGVEQAGGARLVKLTRPR